MNSIKLLLSIERSSIESCVIHQRYQGDVLDLFHHFVCRHIIASVIHSLCVKILHGVSIFCFVLLLSDFSLVQFHFKFLFRNLFQCVTECVAPSSCICSINFPYIGMLGRCLSGKGNINAYTHFRTCKQTLTMDEWMNVGRIEKRISVSVITKRISSKRQCTNATNAAADENEWHKATKKHQVFFSRSISIVCSRISWTILQRSISKNIPHYPYIRTIYTHKHILNKCTTYSVHVLPLLPMLLYFQCMLSVQLYVCA